MKKLVFLALTFLGTMSIFAQGEPFFPCKKGIVLTYADKNPKGKVQSYLIYTVENVEISGNAMSVTYKTESLDEKKQAVMKPFMATVKIEDGYVHFDASSGVGQLTEGMEIKGRGVILPSDMKVGDVLDDYNIRIPNLGMESSCTNNNVTAAESITVEAGTFDCYKVETTIHSKVLFINTDGTTSVWYARNIGSVKTETYDKKGKLISVRELVAIQ